MRIRKFFIFILFIVSLILFSQINILRENKNSVTIDNKQTLTPEKKVDLLVRFGKEEISTFSGVLATTAYDVIRYIDKEVEVKKYDFGIMVTKIGRFENSKTESWLYFVNGKMGEVAADKYILKEGDKVEWRYTKIQN